VEIVTPPSSQTAGRMLAPGIPVLMGPRPSTADAAHQ